MIPDKHHPTQALPAAESLPDHIRQALATERPCGRCCTIDRPALGHGAGVHYARLLCQHCGCFLQWMSQYSDQERLARRQQGQRAAMAGLPPTAPQLAYLQVLGDQGPAPADRAEAAERIDALRVQRGGQFRKKGGAA
jgi:hypothetical protein